MSYIHSVSAWNLAAPYTEGSRRKPGPATKDLTRLNESNFEMCRITGIGPYIKAMIKGNGDDKPWPMHDGKVDKLIKADGMKARNIGFAYTHVPEMFWIYSKYDKADYAAVKDSKSLSDMVELRDEVFLPQVDKMEEAADKGGPAVLRAMFTFKSKAAKEQFEKLELIVGMGSESFLKQIKGLADDDATTGKIMGARFIRPDLAVAAGYVASAAYLQAAKLRGKKEGFTCQKGQPSYSDEAAKWKKLGDKWMKIMLRAYMPFKTQTQYMKIPVGRSYELRPVIIGAFNFESEVKKFNDYWDKQPPKDAAIAKRQAMTRGKYYYRNGENKVVRFEHPLLTRGLTFGGNLLGASQLICQEPADKDRKKDPLMTNKFLYASFGYSPIKFSPVAKAFVFDAYRSANMECGEPPKAPKVGRTWRGTRTRTKKKTTGGGFKFKVRGQTKWK